MRQNFPFVRILALAAGSASLSATSRIQLQTLKDRVLPFENRMVVLEVANAYLDGSGVAEFKLERERNPFDFDVTHQREAVITVEAEQVPSETRYDYTDANVLKLIASSLSNKVAGLLVVGEKPYLQMNKGNLLSIGKQFSVRLPILKNKIFSVLIKRIDSEGYELQLNEAKRFVPFTFDLKEGVTKIEKLRSFKTNAY